MTGIESVRFGSGAVERSDHAGVVMFATPAPVHTPTHHAYGSKSSTREPSNRTAIIGLTSIAVLVAAMAGVALVRMQEAETTGTVVSTMTTVPHGALPAFEPGVTVTSAPQAAVVPMIVKVPHGAAPVEAPTITVVVPHGAVPAGE
jgi:hypothetical protein